MNYFISAVTANYFNFSGRARRAEYWMFYLFYIIFYIVAAVIDSIIGMPLFTGLMGIALIVPSLAVTFRRLHDTSRSAWWLLISLIPLVGAIVLLVFVCQDSHDTNQWGTSPKAIAA